MTHAMEAFDTAAHLRALATDYEAAVAREGWTGVGLWG